MKHQDIYLDPSLTLRSANWTDVNAVAELTYDVAQLEGDVSFVMTAEELANAWHDEGFLVVAEKHGAAVGRGHQAFDGDFDDVGGHGAKGAGDGRKVQVSGRGLAIAGRLSGGSAASG